MLRSQGSESGNGILLIALTLMIPCLLGSGVMAMQGFPPSLWIQNVVAALLGSLAVVVSWRTSQRLSFDSRRMHIAGLIACDMLMITPFLQAGIEGVQRWLSVGPFNLHVAMIVLPISIELVYRVWSEGMVPLALGSVALIASSLSLQPDASQLTGFALAMAVCVVVMRVRRGIGALTIGTLFVACAWSWLNLDGLEPVVYTEGIVSMLGELSCALGAIGLLSVYVLPLALIVVAPPDRRSAIAPVVLYYWGITTSALLGTFPVPILGYGVSPILGYIVVAMYCLCCFVRHEGGLAERGPSI